MHHGTLRPWVGRAAVAAAAVLVTTAPGAAQEPGSWAADLDSLHAAILAALGIVEGTDEPVVIEATGADGRRVEERVRFIDEAWVGPDWVDAPQALNPGPEPLYQRFDENFGFEYIPHARTLYVAFHEVRDDDGETIEAFFGRAFAFADSAGAERLVLDLRENSGGNLDLLRPVLRGVLRRERVDRPGHLFVIIGRDTYSAAIHLAALLERYAHAMFVGEPTGAGPNHFGDTHELILPHSGLVVEIAELYWQGSDPRDERPWITPDLPVDVAFGDYAARRDRVLEAILAYEPDETLGETFSSPMTRWRRPGQLRREVWPALLEPVGP